MAARDRCRGHRGSGCPAKRPRAAGGSTRRGLAGSQHLPALRRADGERGPRKKTHGSGRGRVPPPPVWGLEEKWRDGERRLPRKNRAADGKAASSVPGRAESEDARVVGPRNAPGAVSSCCKGDPGRLWSSRGSRDTGHPAGQRAESRPAIPHAAVPSARSGSLIHLPAIPRAGRGRRAAGGPVSPCGWLLSHPHRIQPSPGCPVLCCCSTRLLLLGCSGFILNCG